MYSAVDTHLDIIAFVKVATFSEQSMGDDFVDVQLVEHWVGVLNGIVRD